MFEKNLRYAYLLDFYGPLFDEHTLGVITAYYDDDLSLAEVAEGVGISRQGVRHIIKKGEEMLEFYESRLGLARQKEIADGTVARLASVRDSLTGLGTSDTHELACEIDDIISSLSEN